MKFIIRRFFRLVRFILGPVVLSWDRLTTPKGIERPEARQEEVDRMTRQLVLYQFRTCPFCIMVRRAVKRLSLNMEMRDAQHNMTHREELLQGGGLVKVPCLKITGPDGEVRWLYESKDIIDHLQQQFA
jgi:glutaredoxin